MMHPYIPELKEKYRKGKVTRREFLRMASLLGLSMGAMTTFLASCSTEEPTATPKPTEKPAETVAEATPVPPEPTAVPGPKRGGVIRLTHNLQRMDDIATVQWAQYNVYRNVAEFLSVTNQDNITVPWLAERWEPSEDLKTWDFYLNKGIKFNHGKDFTADDVVFTFTRLLDPDTGSSTAQQMSYLQATNIEKVDDHHVRFHLDTPQVAVPEHLYAYNNAIMPTDLELPWSDNPVGTGMYTLEEFYPEERAVLKAREGYWRNGADGKPLPYMDQIEYIYLADTAASIAALTSGEVDLISLTAASLDAVEGMEGIVITSQVSSYTPVIRMNLEKPPFDDKRVRNAIKACQDRPRFLEATYRGYGALGEDHHVAPIHPEYCPMDPPPQDYEKAKALLAEAGYEDGIDLTMSAINTDPYITMAQLLQAQCVPAGINIDLDMMPSSLYWEQWDQVDFGVTDWMHRPLAIQVLDLAYRSGVPWNETHFANEEFDELLTEAQGTYDVEARREIMCRLQTILQEEGGVAIPIWGAVLNARRERVKDFRSGPAMLLLDEVWLDDA